MTNPPHRLTHHLAGRRPMTDDYKLSPPCKNTAHVQQRHQRTGCTKIPHTPDIVVYTRHFWGGDNSLRMRTLRFSFPFQIHDWSILGTRRSRSAPHGEWRGEDCGEVSQRASQEAGWRPPLHLEQGGLVVRRPRASQLPLPGDKRHASAGSPVREESSTVTLFTSALPRYSLDPEPALP